MGHDDRAGKAGMRGLGVESEGDEGEGDEGGGWCGSFAAFLPSSEQTTRVWLSL